MIVLGAILVLAIGWWCAFWGRKVDNVSVSFLSFNYPIETIGTVLLLMFVLLHLSGKYYEHRSATVDGIP